MWQAWFSTQSLLVLQSRLESIRRQSLARLCELKRGWQILTNAESPYKTRFLLNVNSKRLDSTFQRGECVQEILFRLWRNEQKKNWTAEINGERHEGVTIEWIHELVYRALLDAEESLVEKRKKPPQ
jgi:hypothetical protein